MIIIRFMLCILIGFIGHQSNRFIEPLEYADGHRPVGMAWYRVLRYAIGGVMLGMGMFVMLGSRRDSEYIIASYFMGAVGVGSGVAAGYYIDAITEESTLDKFSI